MHELSVCQALIDQVEAIARQHNARRVDRILLQVGPLSGVEIRLLEQAYPFAAAGSVAEEAELLIEPIPVRVCCDNCGEETERPPNNLICGRCNGYRTRVVTGDEMLLARVELMRNDEA